MNVDIKEVWAVEQEILDVIHDICMKNKLKYSLFYGTLLGAVRHQGFIPWDDDIDIVMPRNDYNKFVEIWNSNPPKGYILQDYHEWEDIINNFSKIRKDNTTFIQNDKEKSTSYHKGIFVDIFPMDHVAPSRIGRNIQYIAAAVNLLYSRGYRSGSTGLIGLIETVLLGLPKIIRKPILTLTEIIMTHWNKRKDTLYVSQSTINDCKKYFSADLFDDLKLIEFNEKEYMSASDTHMVLKLLYGDYMKLPPEEERVWKHHPIMVDFFSNYEDL